MSDITRSEAIKTLKEHLSHWERLLQEHICEEQEGINTISALKLAIASLETDEAYQLMEEQPEFCEDCISRNAVMDMIIEYRDSLADTGKKDALERAYGANYVGMKIADMPSVLPKTDKPTIIDWNKCHTSEQLDSISTTKNDLGVEHHKQNIQAYAHDFDVSEEQAETELRVNKNDLEVDFKLKDYVSREAVRRIINSPRTQEQMLNALNSLRNATECKAEDCINRDYTAKYVEEFANNEYVSQDEAETIYLIADGIRHIPSALPDVHDNNVGNIDCISREQALKELKESAEHQELRWIPVTEDTPPIGTICLWCNKQGSVFTSEITYRSEYISRVGKHGYFCNGPENYGDIVAWMPLPQNYGEVKE